MPPKEKPQPERPEVHQMPEDHDEPQRAVGFEGSTALAPVAAENVGALSAIARDEGELKAGVVMAKKFPRNELLSYNKLLKSCERPAMAERATYCFPRGGQDIEGPSVDLAREAARLWGNIRYGLRIVSETEDAIHIQGAAFDLETNNLVTAEDKFKKLVFRKTQGWIKPDERDLRELVNRRGAILVRNCLLQVLPPDAIEDAVLKAKETLKKAASGELKQDRQKTIRSLVAAFETVGVTAEMLQAKLGHDLQIINEDEIATLRGIFKSLVDKNSRREEHFDIPKPKGAETGAIDPSQLGPKAEGAKQEKPNEKK